MWRISRVKKHMINNYSFLFKSLLKYSNKSCLKFQKKHDLVQKWIFRDIDFLISDTSLITLIFNSLHFLFEKGAFSPIYVHCFTICYLYSLKAPFIVVKCTYNVLHLTTIKGAFLVFQVNFKSIFEYMLKCLFFHKIWR